MYDELQFYEVLLRRATVNTEQLGKLRTTYHTLLAGMTGEKRVLFELKELQFPHVVIHDFFTKNHLGHTVQVDIIFICQHFVFILEVKNIAGRIDFDDVRRQFIRTSVDGRVESFMNPVDQVKRHRDYLESLLVGAAEFIPVECAMVIANPSTVIGRVSSEVPVFNVSGLRTKISEHMKKYAGTSVNMRRVSDIIRGRSLEPRSRLRKVDFPIREGVLCLSCGERMVVESRGFKCYKCGTWDKDHLALKKTLLDYKVLYGNEITNEKFRQFVGIVSSKTSNKYLKQLKLPYKGENRGRVYLLNHFKG